MSNAGAAHCTTKPAEAWQRGSCLVGEGMGGYFGEAYRSWEAGPRVWSAAISYARTQLSIRMLW